jgi:hypothetical protein
MNLISFFFCLFWECGDFGLEMIGCGTWEEIGDPAPPPKTMESQVGKFEYSLI